MKIKINTKYGHLSHFIERMPDLFEQEGKVIFQGRNVIKSFVAHTSEGDITLIVKRYKCPNFFQKIGYSFFRSTKASRAYENALELRRRGFATPEPYGYVETRVKGLINYCYFISDVDYSHPISEQLNDQSAFNQVMAKDYACFVARLHQKGILDIDLNSGNVLYQLQSDGHYAFSLIDINRMKFYADGKFPPFSECIENLTRFTGRMDVFEYVAREYIKARGMEVKSTLEKMMYTKVKHDRKWEKKKNFLHHFKK